MGIMVVCIAHAPQCTGMLFEVLNTCQHTDECSGMIMLLCVSMKSCNVNHTIATSTIIDPRS